MLKLLSLGLAIVLLFGNAAQAADITLGETALLGYADNGNGNLLIAQGPFHLYQAATVKSGTFYVTSAAGQLRLGIEDSGPNNDCKGGNLKAQTAAFTPHSNRWNTANAVTQVTLPVGNYCIQYLANSNSLAFRKGLTTGVSEVNYPFSFGPMPAQFYSNPAGDLYHWSYYWTLTPVVAPILSVTFNPASPTVANSVPGGTVVAAINATWSDGSQFTGLLSFGSPYNDDGATFAISGSNLIVNPSGPGLSADGNTTQNVTIVAAQ